MSSHAINLTRKGVAQRLPASFVCSRPLRANDSLMRYAALRRTFSSQEPSGRFAVVDHSNAYETAMNGRHGKQLELAQIDGIGKDDPPFDPFIELELMEEQESMDEGNEHSDSDASDDDDNEDDRETDNEDTEELSPYTTDGSLRWKKSQLAAFRAGAPAGGVFAVVQFGSFQHKITNDDVLIVDRIKPLDKFEIGSVHTLTDVMLVSSSHLTLVGMPFVKGAEVDVMVEEITQDAKVIVFKNRRRKNSKRKNGFRRDVTMLRVLDIRMPEPYQGHEHRDRVEVGEPS